MQAPPVDRTTEQLCLPPSPFMAEMDFSTEAQASHDRSHWSASPRMGKKRPRAHGVSKWRDKSHKCLVSRGVGNGGGDFVRMLTVMSSCCLAPGLYKSMCVDWLASPSSDK